MDRLRSALYTTAENVRDLGASPGFNSSRAGQPLRASLARLRVVDLETGKLRSLKLGERYVCISHEWSKHPPGEDVAEAIRMRVRKDIQESVRKYGKSLGFPTAIWLDTVCIDQTDDSDKAYWVPRMGDVYSHAQCTYLILPQGDYLTEIRRLARRHPCHGYYSVEHDCVFAGCSKGHDYSDQELQLMLTEMKRIMDHGWRQRIWIAQESVLSKLIYFLDDSGSLDLREVHKLCGLLDNERSNLGADGHWALRYARWFSERRRMHWLYAGNELGADLVLRFTEKMNSTVPADIYYGLCGLLRIDLAYDKALPVAEVYKRFLQSLLAKGDPSWIRLCVRNPRPSLKGTAIPRRGQYSVGRFTFGLERSAPTMTRLRDDGVLELGLEWSIGAIVGRFLPRDLFLIATSQNGGDKIDSREAGLALQSILHFWLWTTFDPTIIEGLEPQNSVWRMYWYGSENLSKVRIRDLLWPKCLTGKCQPSDGGRCCQVRDVMLNSQKELLLTAVRAADTTEISWVELDTLEMVENASHVIRFSDTHVLCAVSQVLSGISPAQSVVLRFEGVADMFNYKDEGRRFKVPRWDSVHPSTVII